MTFVPACARLGEWQAGSAVRMSAYSPYVNPRALPQNTRYDSSV